MKPLRYIIFLTALFLARVTIAQDYKLPAYQKFTLKNGINKLSVVFNSIPFLSGTYHVSGWIAEYKGKRIHEFEDLIVFEVLPGNTFNDHQGHLKNALLVPDAKFHVI